MERVLVEQFNHIHRAMGGELLKVEAQAAALDPNDPAAVGALAGHLGMIKGILDVHSHEEEEFAWPQIEAKFPNLMAPYLLDHELEHGLFDTINADLASLQDGSATDKAATGKRLYRNIVAVSSHLINHMGKEEKHPYTMFADALTESEEEAFGSALLARIPLPVFSQAMPWMMSFLTDDEVVGDLTLFERILTPETLKVVAGGLSKGLPPERWQHVSAKLPQFAALA